MRFIPSSTHLFLSQEQSHLASSFRDNLVSLNPFYTQCFFCHFNNTNTIYPILCKTHPSSLDICLLSNDIMDYHIVSQGKTTIPSVDDGEEMGFTDVRYFIGMASFYFR